MTYFWYKIFNKTEFEATGLEFKEYTVNLEGLGQKKVIVSLGNYLSMTYEGIMLAMNLNGNNPFLFDGLAMYLDQNNDVWLGIGQDED